MRLIILGLIGASGVAFAKAETTQRFPLGTRAFGVTQDLSSTANVLNAGGGEFIYCKGSTAMEVGTPVVLGTTGFSASAVPNTANLAEALGIAACKFSGSETEYGWVQVSGQAPIVNNGTFATASSVFIQAAGVVTTTAAAGKQILGCRSVVAAAATFTKASVKTQNGSLQVKVPDTNGLFVGLAISGTGIPASTTISDIDPGGNLVTMSAAATATGSITATLTYTNRGVVYIGHPVAQGQIT